MQLTNAKIYQYASDLVKIANDSTVYIPAKANFFLQKNCTQLIELGKEIEQIRLNIAQKYGKFVEEERQFVIEDEYYAIANSELTALFSIVQEVNIYPIKLEDLGNAALTSSQMQAIMFMIEE